MTMTNTSKSPIRGRPMSAAREAVEEALQAATTPASAVTIATITGLDLNTVRIHVRNCCTKNRAHNTTPGSFSGLYAWGSAPITTTAAPRRTQLMGSNGHYTGAELRPFDGRPGAMDAFTKPSIVNGQPVERARPLLIAAGKAVKP
jgi:hypothetical protein